MPQRNSNTTPEEFSMSTAVEEYVNTGEMAEVDFRAAMAEPQELISHVEQFDQEPLTDEAQARLQTLGSIATRIVHKLEDERIARKEDEEKYCPLGSSTGSVVFSPSDNIRRTSFVPHMTTGDRLANY